MLGIFTMIAFPVYGLDVICPLHGSKICLDPTTLLDFYFGDSITVSCIPLCPLPAFLPEIETRIHATVEKVNLCNAKARLARDID